MKTSVLFFGLCLLLADQAASAQQAPPKPAQPPAATAAAGRQIRVIGEVIAADADSRLMAVKADSGDSYTFVFGEQSTYLQVPPGEKTLAKAVPIAPADIGRGDRVYGRGEPLADGKTIPVQQLIVMSQAAISKKHDTEREEWDRRGILGTVVEVRARTKEVVLQARSRGGPPTVTVRIADKATFRRYTPDSVKFADAKPSSLAELKEGDQLRALGERSADGATYQAEQVVSGSFRSTWGTVTAINPETNELRLKAIPGGETVTVVINKDSVLRVMPKEFAAMMAQRMMRGFAGSGRPGMGAGPGGTTGAAPASAPGAQAAAPANRTGMGAPGAESSRRGNDDLLERLPPTTLADLKLTDTVMVFSTAGKNASRVTAIAFVSGVEAFLAAVPRDMPQRGGRGGQGTSLGLPGGALDMGMGLP